MEALRLRHLAQVALGDDEGKDEGGGLAGPDVGGGGRGGGGGGEGLFLTACFLTGVEICDEQEGEETVDVPAEYATVANGSSCTGDVLAEMGVTDGAGYHGAAQQEWRAEHEHKAGTTSANAAQILTAPDVSDAAAVEEGVWDRFGREVASALGEVTALTSEAQPVAMEGDLGEEKQHGEKAADVSAALKMGRESKQSGKLAEVHARGTLRLENAQDHTHVHTHTHTQRHTAWSSHHVEMQCRRGGKGGGEREREIVPHLMQAATDQSLTTPIGKTELGMHAALQAEFRRWDSTS